MIIVQDHEVCQLEFLRNVLLGFGESSLFEDYQSVMGFTDEQWDEAWDTLDRIIRAGLGPSCYGKDI